MAFLEDWNFREEEFLKNLCMTLSGSNCIGNDDVADNLRSPKAVASECGGEIFYESMTVIGKKRQMPIYLPRRFQ